ncbi:dTDP-4-amino-4,6-dideoxygalactose transaminase [Algoriphagus boseongensis]|uniref:dTDP-4-amino-4,6-dideoxygalactose transaminase n=1 Tax=Algoriphagus boseongensis TaxID=1442587 RepID=A0A4R6T8K5_9BACT|nr:dTDP-4-amino-4,6-dideoxygalactose transaminase [Algoriphagus boseongensis]TDQ19598.1 dTDP-4-amino-4,6-dideoxygalactose transaminase [Algoriphagus boseongensis]
MPFFEKHKLAIPFNKPYLSGKELDYVRDAAINQGKLSGNGFYTQKCQQFFEEKYGFGCCLLTNSCTDALEMAALLFDIQAGDEVILPSFTFVSTANAFALRGAKMVFVDSKPDFPGMDESLVESLINSKTKAIIAVHYGGVPCDMLALRTLANKYGIYLLEDAAQAVDSYLEDKALGSFGHLSAFSFHETKNIHCGEGGMLVVNDPNLEKRAEIIWEKGTNRSAYFRGEIDKYSWVDLGSSFLLSELNAAFLWAQLENLDQIQTRRKRIWEDYFYWFSGESRQPQVLPKTYLILLQEVLEEVVGDLSTINFQQEKGNYHLFYLLFENAKQRQAVMDRLKQRGILAVFHYQSLHKSPFIAQTQAESFKLHLPNAEGFSDCLLRLPLFYDLPKLINEE